MESLRCYQRISNPSILRNFEQYSKFTNNISKYFDLIFDLNHIYFENKNVKKFMKQFRNNIFINLLF